MLVVNNTLHRILIGNGSSTDIFFWEAFCCMGIDLACLWPTPVLLSGFMGVVVQPMGVITLSVLVVEHPHISSIMADFIVAKSPSSYNTILGRPMLNNIRAVTSTYHLKMKILTTTRVGEVKGEQVLEKECYMQELKPAKMGVHKV